MQMEWPSNNSKSNVYVDAEITMFDKLVSDAEQILSRPGLESLRNSILQSRWIDSDYLKVDIELDGLSAGDPESPITIPEQTILGEYLNVMRAISLN